MSQHTTYPGYRGKQACDARDIRRAGPGDEGAVVRLVREMAEGEDDKSPIDVQYARHFLASPVSGALLACDGDEGSGC